MSRRPIGTVARCPRCALLPELCLCDVLQPQPCRTQVVVFMHRREAAKPTNTGRLVPLLLEGSEVRLRGTVGAPLELDDVLTGPRRALLLDPTARSVLDPALAAADPRPVTLLAADGTWRQARRALNRHPLLARVTRVRLPAGPPSRYRLRDPRGPEKLATLEAIARALGVLEGHAVQARLEAVFDLLVERTLFSRGAQYR